MSFWSALGGIAGLFGKKPKTISPADSLMSHAKGAILAAEETGFNPLTLLGVGNAGYQTVPGSLGSSGFIADAVEAVGSWFNQTGKADQELRKAQLNERARLESAQAEDPYRSFGYALNTVQAPHAPVAVTLPPSYGLAERPGFWRSPAGETRMFVRLPHGAETTIPADMAKRYGIEPWGTMSVGDATEFGGEVVGETYGVTYANQIDKQMFRYPAGSPGETFFQERAAHPKWDPLENIGAYGRKKQVKEPGFWDYFSPSPW
nr:MAG: DNA pilot protein [Microvirus sp.]